MCQHKGQGLIIDTHRMNGLIKVEKYGTKVHKAKKNPQDKHDQQRPGKDSLDLFHKPIIHNSKPETSNEMISRSQYCFYR